MEQFIESATNVFRGDPRNISMYNFDGGPQGIIPLRRFLVQKLATHRGIHIIPDEVLINSGSGKGIELINDILLEKGDTVIVEGFSFAGALTNLRRRKINMIGIDIDQDGIRMDQLEQALQELKSKGIRPKYIYTIPTLQNPTGTVMTMERRHQILSLSEEYAVPIFEDECYADLIFEGEYENAIRSLDDSNRVLHIGPFSKSLGPGIRLGYVVASWDVMSRLLSRKNDAGTGVMDQMIVGDYFSNHYEEHIRDVRSSLRRKRDALTAALREHFGPTVEFEQPRVVCTSGLSCPRESTHASLWSRPSDRVSPSIPGRTGPLTRRLPPTTSASASPFPRKVRYGKGWRSWPRCSNLTAKERRKSGVPLAMLPPPTQSACMTA